MACTYLYGDLGTGATLPSTDVLGEVVIYEVGPALSLDTNVVKVPPNKVQKRHKKGKQFKDWEQ